MEIPPSFIRPRTANLKWFRSTPFQRQTTSAWHPNPRLLPWNPSQPESIESKSL
jgi:hypothetical protein